MIYDVSVPIENGMPVWPSDPAVSLYADDSLRIDKRHMIRFTTIEMGSHTGTHIDAPYHFVDGGEKLHEIPLQLLVGEVAVFHIAGVRFNQPTASRAIGLAGCQARPLQDRQLRPLERRRVLRGLSSTSNRTPRVPGGAWPAPCRNRLPLHRPLWIRSIIRRIWCCFPTNVVVLEGLNLSEVAPGRYQMVALPLNLQNADGAPTRVILMDAPLGEDDHAHSENPRPRSFGFAGQPHR